MSNVKTTTNTEFTELVVPQQEKTVDFIVKDDFVKKLPQILSNVEQIKQWAIRQTERDRTLLLQTDEDFANAKKRCADINRVIKGIQDKRLEVKRAYTAPYDLFEEKLKEVTGVLTCAKENLWKQVCTEEQRQKDEKAEQIEALYDEIANDVQKEYRPLSKVFNMKWLNRTVKMDAIREEILLDGQTVKREVAAIRALKGAGDASALLLKYKDGATVAEVIEYNARLLAEAAKNPPKEENTTAAGETAKTDTVTPPPAPEDKYELDFHITATKRQLQELKTFLIEHNIEYRKTMKEDL